MLFGSVPYTTRVAAVLLVVQVRLAVLAEVGVTLGPLTMSTLSLMPLAFSVAFSCEVTAGLGFCVWANRGSARVASRVSTRTRVKRLAVISPISSGKHWDNAPAGRGQGFLVGCRWRTASFPGQLSLTGVAIPPKMARFNDFPRGKACWAR